MLQFRVPEKSIPFSGTGHFIKLFSRDIRIFWIDDIPKADLSPAESVSPGKIVLREFQSLPLKDFFIQMKGAEPEPRKMLVIYVGDEIEQVIILVVFRGIAQVAEQGLQLQLFKDVHGQALDKDGPGPAQVGIKGVADDSLRVAVYIFIRCIPEMGGGE